MEKNTVCECRLSGKCSNERQEVTLELDGWVGIGTGCYLNSSHTVTGKKAEDTGADVKSREIYGGSVKRFGSAFIFLVKQEASSSAQCGKRSYGCKEKRVAI
jgi:hypothetical protein